MDLQRLSDQLQELSKDEASFEKLRQLFDRLVEEKNEKEHNLKLLESAIRNDYDAILITELNLEKPGPEIVYVNNGFCRMTGYTRDEVVGKTPRILQGPKTEREVLDRLKEQLSKGRPFFGYTVNYRKDGSEFINQWDIHPLVNADGRVTHWVSYQHDITERKRAEKMVMDAQKTFDQLREESARTILDMDLEGNIVTANKAFRRLTGFGKAELSQAKVWDLFPGKYKQSLQARFEEVKNSGSFSNRQLRGVLKHRSGIPIQVEGKARIIELKDQTLIRAEINNISLQKRIEKALKQCRENNDRIAGTGAEFSYLVVMKDGDFMVEHFSEEFSAVTGLEEETIKSGGLSELVHGDDLHRVKDHLRKVCEGRSHTCEYRLRTQYGDYVTVIDYGRPHRHRQDSNVLCVKGVVRLKQSGYDKPGSRSIH